VNACVTCGFYCGFSLFIRERVGLCRAVESQPAYLVPISNSMQKPIGGRSVLRIFAAKTLLKNHGGEGATKKVGTLPEESSDYI
jgi:hypothetical protein